MNSDKQPDNEYNLRSDSDDKKNQLIFGGNSFENLSPLLRSNILKVVSQKLNFKTMAPVQENTIPLLLSNKDVVVEACTGSGKTLSYLIPVFEIVHRLKQSNYFKESETYGMVICPTRELAMQVNKIASLFSEDLEISTKLLIGSHEDSLATSKTAPSIVIGTPGRILDYIKGELLIVKHLEILILDEADRILDMGFETQINRIFGSLPKQKRVGLFSATQTSSMEDIIRTGLRNPVKVNVEVKLKKQQIVTPKELKNFYMIVDLDQKMNQLISLIEEKSKDKIIVYFLTCNIVDYMKKLICKIFKKTEKEDLYERICALHGKMEQKKRNLVYQSFLEKQNGVLFCTDVAARGLDFPDITCIIQFDPPCDPSMYIHRVGRTARMGKSGISILFLGKKEDNYVEYLEVKKVPVEKMEPNLEAKDYFSTIRELTIADRDLIEKSSESFISYLRAYREHQCNYIFKLNELDVPKLAKAFCLFEIPKIYRKEFTKMKISLPKENEGVDVASIPYLDSKREKARLLRLEKEKQKQKQVELEDISKKKDKNDKKLHQKKQEIRNNRDVNSKNRKRVYELLEKEEMDKEISLLKKLKKGKISEAEYEELTGEKELLEQLDDFIPSTKDKSNSGSKSKKQRK